LRPSRPRSWVEEKVRVVTGTRYYRCSKCGRRARHPRTGREGTHRRRDLRFWVVAALVGAGFLFALRLVG
jgi:hypothetical protein